MPVRNTEADVTLRLLMLMVTMLLLYHHSDARPVMNCRPAATADKRHLSVAATSTACFSTVHQPSAQQSLETLGNALTGVVTHRSSTVQQVTHRAYTIM